MNGPHRTDLKEILSLDTPLDRLIHRPPARALAALLASTPVTPNQLTVTSVLPSLAAAWCFSEGTFESAAGGTFFFYLWAVLDHADGELARLKKMTSRFGKMLDDACDMISSNLMLLGIFAGILPFWNARDRFIFKVLFLTAIVVHAFIGVLLLRGKRKARQRVVERGSATEHFVLRQKFLDHFTGREPFYFLLSLTLCTLYLGGVFWYSALMTILVIGSAVLTVLSALVYWDSKRF